MIDSGELKKGLTIELDDKLYQVIAYQHIKVGRGSATVKLKLHDIRSGHTIERSFQASEKFKRARLDSRAMQYLYNDGDSYYFMDEKSFEQMPISPDQLGDALDYLKENMSVEVSSYQGKLIGVELPITVELEVVETGPGFKGDTATAGNKPAKLETGITIQVPLFISNGDIIKVDTRTGQYLERVS
ncbi:MAG: elongation factor P [Dehalococcoidales bacterium]|jgi:elongation factor P|nr:elongation factor P [Dehalococcoidales bacterium]